MSELHVNYIDKMIAEQMTGVREHPGGLGKFYTAPWNDKGCVKPGGDELAGPSAAFTHIWMGYRVAVPNAGSGSYREFFEALGFVEVRSVQDASSAGDWTLAVRTQGREDGPWHLAYQNNRYPRHGFEYSVDSDRGFPSFETLCDYLAV